MSAICLIISIILFVLVGFEVEPAALDDFNLLGFGLAFFSASFLPWTKWLA